MLDAVPYLLVVGKLYTGLLTYSVQVVEIYVGEKKKKKKNRRVTSFLLQLYLNNNKPKKKKKKKKKKNIIIGTLHIL